MSLFYRIAYGLAFHPWERASETHGHMIAALLEREEMERRPPYGAALDLGCGSGAWTIELARRGWDATGIDNVPKAINRAYARAQEEGVKVKFVLGSVTALRAAGVGAGIRLFLDIGCFQGLSDDDRAAMGAEVDAVADTGAVLLALSFAPGRRGPLPRGASVADMERAFRGWNVIKQDPVSAAALPPFLKNADPRVYRLRREA